jgi:hypothetical protein
MFVNVDSICNIEKADLDENFQARNISNGFKVHIANEHNMWNYLFYSIYLFHKVGTWVHPETVYSTLIRILRRAVLLLPFDTLSFALSFALSFPLA